jgi:glycosyltransferase involved in cell wall biosynthesis
MRVSVIVCTYNHAHFLPDALGSAAAQTFREFEIVVVDDGSTDETPSVIRSFEPAFDRFVHVWRQHGGINSARTLGVETARGAYLAFLDSDDVWAPTYLESMLDVWSRSPVAELVACDAVVARDGVAIRRLFPDAAPAVCGPIREAQDVFAFFRLVAPSAMVFTRSLFERVGAFDAALPNGTEDWDWLIRAIDAGAFCVRLDRPLVCYRHHGANVTRNVAAMFEGWLATYAKNWASSNDRALQALAWKFTRRSLVGLLATCDPATSRKLLRQVIDVMGHEPLLRTTTLLTRIGACGLLKTLRAGKRALAREPVRAPMPPWAWPAPRLVASAASERRVS